MSPAVPGNRIPLNCAPPGESPAALSQVEVRVRLWCAQNLTGRLARRRMVQTKLKLGIDNRSSRPLAVGVERWAVLIADRGARERWAGKPGAGWKAPQEISFDGRDVTAIFANPDDQSELLGRVGEFENYTFETHWRQRRVASQDTFQPPSKPASGERDGVWSSTCR